MAQGIPGAGSPTFPAVTGTHRYSTKYWDAVQADLLKQDAQFRKNNPNKPVGNPKPLDLKLLEQ